MLGPQLGDGRNFKRRAHERSPSHQTHAVEVWDPTPPCFYFLDAVN